MKSAPVVPPQHGAWAFLGLPVLVGCALTSWTPLIAVLAAGWVAAYPASYFLLAIVADTARRRPQPGRFVRPLAIWTAPTLVAAVVLVWFRPWLLWVGVGYLVAFGVNLAFARRRDERALVNDVVFVAECAGMVVVTWAVGVGARTWTPPAPVPSSVWILTAAVALVLTGSTLHVKSLIRERSDPRYARASRAVAVVSVVLAAALAAWWGLPSGWWLVLPFGYFVVRSFAVRRPPKPGVIGVIELVGFVLLALAAFAVA